MEKKRVRMDNKQRICLSSFLSKDEREHLSSFQVTKEEDGKIILEPLIEILASDHWIYKQPQALESLMEGLEDARKGHIEDPNIDFSEFLEKDEI